MVERLLRARVGCVVPTLVLMIGGQEERHCVMSWRAAKRTACGKQDGKMRSCENALMKSPCLCYIKKPLNPR